MMNQQWILTMVPDRITLEVFMDDTVAETLTSDHITGGVITIVHDGHVLFTKGYGYVDKEALPPVDPSRTVFRVVSLTKPFISTAILQL